MSTEPLITPQLQLLFTWLDQPILQSVHTWDYPAFTHSQTRGVCTWGTTQAALLTSTIVVLNAGWWDKNQRVVISDEVGCGAAGMSVLPANSAKMPAECQTKPLPTIPPLPAWHSHLHVVLAATPSMQFNILPQIPIPFCVEPSGDASRCCSPRRPWRILENELSNLCRLRLYKSSIPLCSINICKTGFQGLKGSSVNSLWRSKEGNEKNVKRRTCSVCFSGQSVQQPFPFFSRDPAVYALLNF